MASTYKLSRLARVLFALAAVGVPVLTVIGMFVITDDGLEPHQDSRLVSQYVDTAPADPARASEQIQFSTRYGQSDGTETLVLYDDEANRAEHSEMYAIAAGNLATHFGMVNIQTLKDYQSGDLTNFDAVIYLGIDDNTEVPTALIQDVHATDTPVLWVGENSDALAGNDATTFTETYGWDPTDALEVDGGAIKEIGYDGATLDRYQDPAGNKTIATPHIIHDDDVEILATGQAAGSEKTKHPWVIRSQNLTYLTELPFHFIDHNDLYLVYADLYYDLLDPERADSQLAAVRLEDVNPESDPDQLRAIADYLHSQDVPFQVAVIPVMLDRTQDAQDWYGLSLLDVPEVAEALQYMQERGGTLIQHGTTHQLGAENNPYSGRTGDDYEFYVYGCSATQQPPYQWETCQQNSWVRKKQPVADDQVDQHSTRLEHGREIMREAGLGDPAIFETPHYTASVNAYVAMSQLYEARYEQVEYYAGMISDGNFDPEYSYGQIFPYTVHDIYGSTVYPENLQNPTEEEQNNHPARSSQTIIDRAEANLAVTESTASFYFHPFLDMEYLEEIVEGVQDLGYEFVPVTELH